jgi:hypothetical protein
MLAVLFAVAVFAGCGNGDAKQTGAKVGQAVTDFATGVGHGVDKGMEVVVELSPEVAAMGLTSTIAKHTESRDSLDKGKGDDAKTSASRDRRKGISVYIVAKNPVKCELMAKAVNAAGHEIGRTTTAVEFSADDAKYVVFGFDSEMDTQLVAKYLIDAKNPAGTGVAPSKDAKAIPPKNLSVVGARGKRTLRLGYHGFARATRRSLS